MGRHLASLAALLASLAVGCGGPPRAPAPQPSAATTTTPAPTTKAPAAPTTSASAPPPEIAPPPLNEPSPPAAPPALAPCPPPGGQPPGALAWVSGDKILTASPIRFALNADAILEESAPILDSVASIVVREAALNVEIAAHTDGRGSRQRSVELAQARASAVKKYLVTKGASEARLTTRVYEYGRAVANVTPVGRARARRIEFTILCAR